MLITYTFTIKEKELIRELHSMNNSYDHSSTYDNFRNKYSDELSTFIKEGLLYHSNPDSDGAYIRLSVSQKGLEAFKFIDNIA